MANASKIKKIEITRQTIAAGKVITPGEYWIGKDLLPADAAALITAGKAVEIKLAPKPKPAPEPEVADEPETDVEAPAVAEVTNRDDNPAQAPKKRSPGRRKSTKRGRKKKAKANTATRK